MTDAHWWPARSANDRQRGLADWASLPRPPSSGAVEVLSDTDLLHLLTDGDKAALAELYERFGLLCYSLARRICADDGLAEDVVHEVFLVLWRDPRRFDPTQGSVATWLLTMLHRTAVDTARRQRAVHWRTTEPDAVGQWSVAGADQVAKARVMAGQVRAALDRLPGEQRQVLVGAYFGGHTLHEIAAVTGVPLGTVKSRLFTGVQRLRTLLSERLGPDALVAEARAIWKVSR